jgi:outer membrane protein OmpA-like peptidoglycan-associated protein
MPRFFVLFPCLIALAVIPLPVVASKSLVLDVVNFPFESSEASPYELMKLERVMCALNGRVVTWVAAVGHAAPDERQALPLSHARAEFILRKLESKGLRAMERHSDGKGSMQPVAGNATNRDRRKNGRVEIEIGYVYDDKQQERKCE